MCRYDEMARIQRMNGVVEPARGMHGFVGPPRVWKRFPRTGGLAVSRAFGDTNLSTAGVIAEPEIHTERIGPRWGYLYTLTPPDPLLKGAWFQPLSLSSENPVSKFAFHKRGNLYRYAAG